MILEYSAYDGFLTALAVMIFGLFFGIPALAFLSELSGIIRKKVFIDKYARQSARLGLLLMFAVLLFLAVIWISSIHSPQVFGTWITYGLFWEFALYICLAATILLSLYYFLWNKLNHLKILHLFLGALSVAFAAALTSMLFWTVYREFILFSGAFPEASTVFAPILAQTLTISLSGAACLSLLYLLLRRSRDDYGRDYYRFALSFGARWAMLFILISPAACIWLFLAMDSGLDLANAALPGAIYALALIAMVIILRRISISSQPLRNKAGIAICPILVWLIIVFRLVSYLEFTNMASGEDLVHTFVRNWPMPF